MKIAKITDKILVRRSAFAGLLLVLVATLTLEATSIVQYLFARRAIRQEASMRAEGQLETTRVKILDIIDQAETAVRNSVWLVQWSLDYPDSLRSVCRRMVTDNPVVVGSTVALVPGFDKKRPLFSPYVYEGDDGLVYRSLATPEYDYPSQEWFRKPVELEDGYWSEPYLDTGGGDIIMTTYSVPVRDRYGNIAAVVTADISLDWLTTYVSDAKVYPNAFNMVISRAGRIMVCPVEELVMHKTVDEVASELDDTAAFAGVNRAMLSGKAGNLPVRYEGVTSHVFFAPVERTGWSMSVIIPDSEIYGGIRKIGLVVKILQVIGILMLILIINALARSQLKFRKMDEARERMNGELRIASGIQMSMIPKIFPPFPERTDIDMSAAIIPAKEVGGDLYDFFIRDEKLFFCVGDVSGKGVPASLVMAVTRSMFRMVAAHEDSPGRLVRSMNDSMSDMNDSNMFVTFFCGVLDMVSGQLKYCNAGHNAPMMLTDAVRTLPVESNLPLGIMQGMDFVEQETSMAYDDAIFLYTDGLTEAENSVHEMFGEERVREALHGRKTSAEHLKVVSGAVAEFVGDAPQSDDLTLLFIHYLAKPGRSKLHLSLKNDTSELSALEDFVFKACEIGGFDEEMRGSLNLALEEAVTNVMMYAYPEGTEGQVDIDAVSRRGALRFVVTDSGKPFDPTAVPDPDVTLEAEDRQIGGLGIFLVRKIMDSVVYERRDGKNILTMSKKI